MTTFRRLGSHYSVEPPSPYSPRATMILLKRGQMVSLNAVIQQLWEEHTRAQSELKGLDQAISAIESLGITVSTQLKRGRGRRTLSPDARRRIAAAQKRRWARVKREKGASRSKRVLSPAARRRIAAAQKARWAQFRAAKKK